MIVKEDRRQSNVGMEIIDDPRDSELNMRIKRDK